MANSTPKCTADDCDWKYDGGDASIGINPGWECQTCGAIDVDREPPSDPEDNY